MNDDAGWSAGLKLFWLVVGGGLCLLWGAALVLHLAPTGENLTDFAQEWASARNYFTGRPIYLNMNQSIPLHTGRVVQMLLEVNAHPPASVLVALPFGKLDYAQALLVWNVMSLVLLVHAVWLVMRPRGLDFNGWAVLPFATFLLVSNSLAQQVNQGQWNLVLLSLMAAAWAAERQDRLAVSGALIGVATAIKLFPGFLFLYFVVRKKWNAVLFGTIAFCALNGLTAIVLGQECFRDYIQDVLPQLGVFRNYWANASIAGFWSKLFDGSSGHVIPLWRNVWLAQAGTVVSCLIIFGMTAWKIRQAELRAGCDHAFGLCVVAMLLVSPITWDHYFLLLVLPLAVMWKVLPATRFRQAFLLLAIIVLGVLRPKYIWESVVPGDGELAFGAGVVPSVALPWHTLTAISYQLYALLTLFIFGWLAKPRSRGPSQTAQRADPTAENLLAG